MSIRFTELELKTLHRSVADAEAGTPGEIVVFVVQESGAYEAVLWRGGALGLAAAIAVWAVLAAVWHEWGQVWLWSPAFDVALFALGALAGAALTKRLGGLFRLLAGKKLLAGTVKRRAQRAFLEEGVVETAERTGILIFVSVLERRIEVIADKGISSVVPESSWAKVVQAIGDGLKQKHLIEGLTDGVSASGDLLRASGIAASGVDRNELSDDIRLETN